MLSTLNSYSKRGNRRRIQLIVSYYIYAVPLLRKLRVAIEHPTLSMCFTHTSLQFNFCMTFSQKFMLIGKIASHS